MKQRRYRVVRADNESGLFDALTTRVLLDAAKAKVDELAADKRAKHEDCWYAVLDRYAVTSSEAIVYAVGVGSKEGKPFAIIEPAEMPLWKLTERYTGERDVYVRAMGKGEALRMARAGQTVDEGEPRHYDYRYAGPVTDVSEEAKP